MAISLMHRLAIQLLGCFVRLALRLRYRVKVEGLEKINSLKGSKPGVLFLPNHPAEIDPIILMSLLAPNFFPRSVIVEHFYYLKGFQFIMDLARVVPIPTMAEKANRWKEKEVAKILENLRLDLLAGENYIIYPAGKLKRSSWELLGGASFVHNLVQKNPEIPVVLVRTTGLWGSSFSAAQTGSSPRFQSVLKHALKVILKNLVFLVPKRDVLVQLEIASDLPKEASRLEFNRVLESWYNQYPFPGEEPLALIPYSRWNPNEEIPVAKAVEEEDEEIVIPPQIESEVRAYLATLSTVSDIRLDSHLSFDLGLDSLDIAQIYPFLDKKYGIAGLTPGSLVRVKDILKVIARKETIVISKKIEEPSSSFPNFQEKKKRKKPSFPGGQVIPEVFLKTVSRMGSCIACADRNSGAFSYKALKRSVLVLCQKFKKLPGERVAVLLPASVASYLSILALLFAKKIPVMLNWTAGTKALSHAVKQGAFQSVITSKKFLDKIPLEDLTEIEDLFVFLEDVKTSINWKEKIRGLWMSFLSPRIIMKKLAISSDPEQMAVLLFTSGTEALPKAVPLTHRQILMNQKGSLDTADIKAEDSFYSVLPPFHSFGFSLTGILPLLFGIKVFYGPDPTDSRQMSLDIEQSQASVFCCAPSFVRSLIVEATEEQLKSIKLLVVGAERMPPDLLESIQKKLEHVILVEGYGITECAPVVTIQRMNGEKKGVGEPISGVHICIVDPVSLELLEQGSEGEVWISGCCVFDGYLGGSSDPFVYKDGTKWYRSGDLGRVDEDGSLYITDRLKRMMKIGAEMVSLGGVESELLSMAKHHNWISSSQEGPPLAVVSRDDGNQKAEIVLFTTFSVSKELINQILRGTGFGRIVKISEIVQVEEIPLTGTGKTHHRTLEERLKKEKKESCLSPHLI
ncbi:MAG: AMP-binding protein [Rhabdochlamydiaceae bacterium]|nr:AMP-binding protein [Rhabdochlamydiaceae bacterium]